jgi:hypothetical protein
MKIEDRNRKKRVIQKKKELDIMFLLVMCSCIRQDDDSRCGMLLKMDMISQDAVSIDRSPYSPHFTRRIDFFAREWS